MFIYQVLQQKYVQDLLDYLKYLRYLTLVILGVQLSIMVNLNGTKSTNEFLTCEFEIIFEQWNDPFHSMWLNIR